ncbi:hypothetical protein AV530_014442 [Patagioenas fasciata monilis]|uniref:Uncharacterized protein n=1 Tax=Patagioenas fasciata monilis TaxID=372326 RepID=A0A1V4KBY3_PATFA|nr:hypothetical protein AV530_014442 [Patagioenas fasciata monilis]
MAIGFFSKAGTEGLPSVLEISPSASVCQRQEAVGRYHGKTCIPSLVRSCTLATSPMPGTAGSAVYICNNSSAHLRCCHLERSGWP